MERERDFREIGDKFERNFPFRVRFWDSIGILVRVSILCLIDWSVRVW